MRDKELYGDDPKQEEFLASIKAVERTRFWFPFALLGFLVFYLWIAGEPIFQRPEADTAYPLILLVGLIFVGTEVLNVKVLLLKSEYRDWLRDFRPERWKDMNDH